MYIFIRKWISRSGTSFVSQSKNTKKKKKYRLHSLKTFCLYAEVEDEAGAGVGQEQAAVEAQEEKDSAHWRPQE